MSHQIAAVATYIAHMRLLILPVLLGLAGCGDVTAIPGDAPVPRAAPASVAQQADAAAVPDLPDRQSVCGPDAPPEVQENCARERPRTQSVTRPKEWLDDPLALDRPECGPGAPLSLDPRCAPLGTAPGRGPVVHVPRDRPPSPGEVAEARADLEARQIRIDSGQATPLSGERAALDRARIRLDTLAIESQLGRVGAAPYGRTIGSVRAQP